MSFVLRMTEENSQPDNKKLCERCKKFRVILAKEKCASCYQYLDKKSKEQFAPRITCQCNPACDKLIPYVKTKKGKYRRYYHGHNSKGENHPMWNGGKNIDSYNYLEIYKPDYFKTQKNRHVKEHIYIYQEYHKLCMLKWGRVHHKDKNRQNNDISNLEGMTHSQHMKLHNIIDMSNRFCLHCNSKETLYDKKRCRPHWYSHNDGFLCNKCYCKEKRRKLKK